MKIYYNSLPNRIKQFMIICFILLMAGSAGAAIIEVEAGDNWFATIQTSLAPGDTIIFVTDGGVYNSPVTIDLPNTPLTLMAKDGLLHKPILKSDVAGSMFKVYADLTVIGLAFDGSFMERGEAGGTYRFIQVSAEFSKLEISDSDFYNLRGYGITSSNSNIDSLIINNVIFRDFKRIPVYFKDRRDLVKYTRITNSTFYNIDDIGVYIWGASRGFEVIHCTFSGLTNINLYPKEIFQNVIIRDNIIASANVIGVKVYGDNPVVQYNLFFNNSLNIEYMGSGSPDFETGTIIEDPLFEDAALGMFALNTNSPAIATASDGTNMGDPRWGVFEQHDTKVRVTFSVTVPEYTPSNDLVYLAGNFNGWDPGAQPMVKVGQHEWRFSLQLLKNSNYEYKYSRGSWSSVEKDTNGEEIPNRNVTVSDTDLLLQDVVASWADIHSPIEIKNTPPVLTFYNDQPQHCVAITWISEIAGNSYLRYGVNDVSENTHFVTEFKGLVTENDSLANIARLSGLTENTSYLYQIVTENDTTGEIYQFKTAAYDDEFMFIVGGDNQLEVYQPIVGTMAAQEAEFMLHVGDLVVDGTKLSEWFTFLETFKELSPKLPIMPVYGNHESDSPNLGKFFTLPPNNDSNPDNENHWYSFSYNNIYFMGLDMFRDYDEGSNQYNWLVNELQQIDRNVIDHIIVVLHYGPYASLGYHGPNTLVRQRLLPLFEQYGVAVTFSGHNHFYERSIVNGKPHFVTGGLSIWLKDFTPGTNPWSAYVEKSNHFLKVYVKGKRLRVEMVRANGTVADIYENFQVDGRDIDWGSHVIEPVTDQENLMTDPEFRLHRLYVHHDDDFYYFGFDAPATNKAVSYGLYIDTDNKVGSGGNTDCWGKGVAAVNQHLPEIQIYAYHNSYDSWSGVSPSYYYWDAGDQTWITAVGGVARLPEGGLFEIDRDNRFFEIAIPRDAPGFNAVEHFHVKLFNVGSTNGAGVSAVLPNDDQIRFTEENTSTQTTLLTDFYWYNEPDTTTVEENPILIDGDPADWKALEIEPVAVATNTSQNNTQYKIDSLLVHMDEKNLYLGYRTNAVNERIHFGIYIDTDNVPNSGGATNPWGASVTTVPQHRPEIAIFAYHNEMGGWSGTSPQYYIWTRSSWVRQSGGQGNMPPGGQFAHQQSMGFVEMLIPRNSPGLVDVESFYIVLYNFGMTKYVAEVVPSDPLVAYTGQNPSTSVELRYFAWYEHRAAVVSKTDDSVLPETIQLYQNYPNPFNPTTTIRFALPYSSKVKLDIFNMLGQQVATLLNEHRSAGVHQLTFDAAGLPSGIYLYRLKVGSYVQTRKILLIR